MAITRDERIHQRPHRITIVTYHYVRELPYTRYPRIRGLLASHFKGQLDYLRRHYTFVTMADCLHAVQSPEEKFPYNAALLTFDDAYIDHFVTVFPLLNALGIQGCFFPPAKAVMEHEVLDVNKIHFVLAAAPNMDALMADVFTCLDEYRSAYQLQSNEFYYSKLIQETKAQRFDAPDVIFVKRLLQRELASDVKRLILNTLFAKYVSRDEAAFSEELYMSVDQLQCMIRHGMYVGSHGYDHCWLSLLPRAAQEREVRLSLEFLRSIGGPTEAWSMCYPYGMYNESLLEVLRGRGCQLGFTTKVGIATLIPDNALTLERLDTNDFPRDADAEPNAWTQHVLTARPTEAPR